VCILYGEVIAICVNRRYFAMRGILTDVGGKIFDTRRRKTTRARRIETETEKYQRTLATDGDKWGKRTNGKLKNIGN